MSMVKLLRSAQVHVFYRAPQVDVLIAQATDQQPERAAMAGRDCPEMRLGMGLWDSRCMEEEGTVTAGIQQMMQMGT
ncbi:hypothetical protein KH389_07110 [Pseudomonas qingdaonensis]|uniref:Uncharacterized protein n=1 Tax=Pseudomonas qingdaonensis TaxID=2056231 RepID=A0ABX8DVN7_9PSED|nr:MULTISPECIES: hypothetical protein [Pseudomonas]MDD1954315.1 hypothetical protein [Pseudomonas sp. 8209]QVL20344.1 hypothetical protein KH389_07110 [Pseudomonas qingdaonensis]